MIFLLSFYTLLSDATYIFNFIFQSIILLGVFRTIKIKFRTSGLLVVSRYSKYLNERYILWDATVHHCTLFIIDLNTSYKSYTTYSNIDFYSSINENIHCQYIFKKRWNRLCIIYIFSKNIVVFLPFKLMFIIYKNLK